jgi:hypothetical protein
VEQVQDIRRYAKEELGLNLGRNYTRYVKIDTYRLFIPEDMSGEAIPAEVVMELTLDLQEMLKKYTANVERTLKKRGFLFEKAIYSLTEGKEHLVAAKKNTKIEKK